MSALPIQPQSGPSNRIRAMVVDDSAVTLQTISNFLQRHSGVDVVGTAQDGAEAVERVRQLHPDLVLMDVQMPVMNGLEATANILQEFPSTLVVMITVNDTPELRTAAIESGASHFVPKPQLWRSLPDILRKLRATGVGPSEEQPEKK